MAAKRERMLEELERLVDAYLNGERQYRAEAWNLIADFTVCNWEVICDALKRTDQ